MSDITTYTYYEVYGSSFDEEDVMYLRKVEETDEKLIGQAFHPDHGAGVTQRTVMKENILGWEEKVHIVYPEKKKSENSILTRIGRFFGRGDGDD